MIIIPAIIKQANTVVIQRIAFWFSSMRFTEVINNVFMIVVI